MNEWLTNSDFDEEDDEVPKEEYENVLKRI